MFGMSSLPFSYLAPIFGIGATDQQTRALRLAICEPCPNYSPKSKQCGVCRCYLPAKVKVPAESCPINKWGAVPR